MTRPRCALGRVIASGIDTDEVKRCAWLRDGWLVVHIDDERMSWDQKEYVRQIGDMLNGKRKVTE